MNYIVYDKTGKILRTVQCTLAMKYLQAHEGEFVTEGVADDATQKITNIGIKGKVVNKTPQEIEADKPSKTPIEKQAAHITNKQWQDVLDQLEKLKTIK